MNVDMGVGMKVVTNVGVNVDMNVGGKNVNFFYCVLS